MTTWLIRCFAFLLFTLPFVPAVADDPDDQEIARLVKQLGSSDFRTREAATKRLNEIADTLINTLESRNERRSGSEPPRRSNSHCNRDEAP